MALVVRCATRAAPGSKNPLLARLFQPLLYSVNKRHTLGRQAPLPASQALQRKGHQAAPRELPLPLVRRGKRRRCGCAAAGAFSDSAAAGWAMLPDDLLDGIAAFLSPAACRALALTCKVQRLACVAVHVLQHQCAAVAELYIGARGVAHVTGASRPCRSSRSPPGLQQSLVRRRLFCCGFAVREARYPWIGAGLSSMRFTLHQGAARWSLQLHFPVS